MHNQQGLQMQSVLEPSDSLVAIHRQINNSLRALQTVPSLSLIHSILQELIFYDIDHFLRDYSLLSHPIQKLMMQYDIFAHILAFLLQTQQKTNEKNKYNQQKRPNQQNRLQELPLHKESSEKAQQMQLQSVLVDLGVICSQSIQVSELFLPLLHAYIGGQAYDCAALMVANNQFFLSEFHKAGWSILRSPKHHIAHILSFLQHFCNNLTPKAIYPSSLAYRLAPSTSNQYLLFHTIQPHANRIFQYELYSEGIYVFIHDHLSARDTQLHTFVDNQEAPEINMLVAELNFIRALVQGNNINITPHYWTLVSSLAPYCFRENFPQLSNPAVKKSILGLIIEMGPSVGQSKLLANQNVGFVLGSSDQKEGLNGLQIGEVIKVSLGKDMRRQLQSVKKLLRQLGSWFLRRCKEWCLGLRDKSIQMKDLLSQECLEEWLCIMLQVLRFSLIKVKAKEAGKLLSYITKIFQSMDEQTNYAEDTDLLVYFLQFLLQILKYHPKNNRYLQHLRAIRNYHNKPIRDQLNKVIGSLQNKRDISFAPTNGPTKRELIEIVTKNMDQPDDPNNANQPKSAKGIADQRKAQCDDQVLTTVKMRASRVLRAMMKNVNEQLTEESLQTLNYMTKHPSLFSSFSLMDILPKYSMQNQTKKIILEQIYLSSNKVLLAQLLAILRMMYRKKHQARNRLNQFLLLDSPRLYRSYAALETPIALLKQLTVSLETWLRPALLDKYPSPLQTCLGCLSSLRSGFNQLNGSDFQGQFCTLVENTQIFQSVKQLLEFIEEYFVAQRGASVNNKSKGQSQGGFQGLAEGCLGILQIYVLAAIRVSVSKLKIFMAVFCELLSRVPRYSGLLMTIYQSFKLKTQQEIVDIVSCSSPRAIAYLFTRLPSSVPFFHLYALLDPVHLILQVHHLYLYAVLERYEEQEQLMIEAFVSGNLNKDSTNQKISGLASTNDFAHQMVLIQIVCKLLDGGWRTQFVQWFGDTMFPPLLDHIARETSKNYFSDISSIQVKRKQYIFHLCVHFKRSNNKLLIQTQGWDINSLMIDWCMAQIRLCHELLNELGAKDKIQFLQYLQFVVCDMGFLAYNLDLLKVGQITTLLQYSTKRLGDIVAQNITIAPKTQQALPFIEMMLIGTSKPKIRKIVYGRAGNHSESSLAGPVRSKPIKKWIGALHELNQQKFINGRSELMDQISGFGDIYQLKNGAQQLNLVINQSDILLKLLQISLNLNRLELPVEECIFLLEELYLIIRKVHLKGLIDATIKDYAQQLLDSIVEDQHIHEQGQSTQWRQNVYCVSLKLMIIDMAGCSWAGQDHRNIQNILGLLKFAHQRYSQDCLFLFSFFTASPREIYSFFDFVIPLQIILKVIGQQVFLWRGNQSAISRQVLSCYYLVNFGSGISRMTRKQVRQILGKADESVLASVQDQMAKLSPYRQLKSLGL